MRCKPRSRLAAQSLSEANRSPSRPSTALVGWGQQRECCAGRTASCEMERALKVGKAFNEICERAGTRPEVQERLPKHVLTIEAVDRC